MRRGGDGYDAYRAGITRTSRINAIVWWFEALAAEKRGEEQCSKAIARVLERVPPAQWDEYLQAATNRFEASHKAFKFAASRLPNRT